MVFGWEGGGGGGREKGRGSSRIGGGGSDGEGEGMMVGMWEGVVVEGGAVVGMGEGVVVEGMGEGVVVGRKGVQVSGLSDGTETLVLPLWRAWGAVAVVEVRAD